MGTNDTNQPETQSEPNQARCAVPICSAPALKSNVMVRLEGQSRSFRCECGCNVFHEVSLDPLKYGCNGCDAEYFTS